MNILITFLNLVRVAYKLPQIIPLDLPIVLPINNPSFSYSTLHTAVPFKFQLAYPENRSEMSLLSSEYTCLSIGMSKPRASFVFVSFFLLIARGVSLIAVFAPLPPLHYTLYCSSTLFLPLSLCSSVRLCHLAVFLAAA